MRKLFILLGFILCCFSGFAYDGLMSGEKNLKVIQTKWFDIVYPESSQRSALVLYENVDRVYEEVGQMYGFPPQFRMPVVLTSSVENFNAYWSPFPYNHIALYDTFAIDDLDVFSENLVSTFRHEVIHAFSYNNKNKFWKALSFFGDIVNPGYLFITQGWAEGATVSGESAGGEGRLNNEFTLQMVKQAKIESQFPRYRDVQGASDKYPLNTFYYFNGAFNQWLQKTYGMEKYAAFWYKCVNFQTISTHLAFKKVYGISLEKAWTLFKDEIVVPEVDANPIDSGLVRDFFESSNSDYSIKNKAGSLYSSLTLSNKGLAYIDSKTGSVYFVDKKDFSNKKIKARKLFSKSGIENISFSDDGRYLAAGWSSDSKAATKQKSSVYDWEKHRFIMEENSLANPAIIHHNENYYMVAQKYKNQQYSVVIKPLDSDKKTDEFCFELPVFENCRSFTDVSEYFGKASFAAIKKAGSAQSFVIYDINGNCLKEVAVPENMYVRYPSFDRSENSIVFSFVEKGTLPRLGSLNLDSGNFTLQSKDLSGGIYYPVSVDSGTIIYEGQFFRQNRMFFADKDELLGNEGTVLAARPRQPVSAEVPADSEQILQKLESLNPKNYNPFKFYSKGVFLPVSLVTSNSYSKTTDTSYLLPFGATYISSNPWSSGIFIGSAGYGLTTNSWGLDLAYQSSSSTSLYNYLIEGMVEFDTWGWKQVNGTVQGSLNIPVGRISMLKFSDSGDIFFGRGNDALSLNMLLNYHPGVAMAPTLEVWLRATNTLSAGYSNIRKVGPGKYEKGGFSVTATFVYGNLTNVSLQSEQKLIANLGLNVTSYLPKLIPILCEDRFTYNLPTRLTFEFLPYGSSSGKSLIRPASYDSLFGADSETILFGYDIQKALPGLTAIFVNNVQLSAVYCGALNLSNDFTGIPWKFARLPELFENAAMGKFSYSQWIALRLSIGLTPNFGALANRSFKMDYFVEGGFNTTFSTGSETLVRPSFTVGYSSNF